MASNRRILRRDTKGGFAIVHVPDEPFGEVEPSFNCEFNHELPRVWTLIDETGNRHHVGFNKCLRAPLITDGWRQLREFYGMTGNHTVYLRYLGNGIFQISVLQRTITPAEFPSYHSLSTKHPRPTFTLTLAYYNATASQLDLPQDFAAYVRSTLFTRLLLEGPSGDERPCKILIRDGPKKSTKLGQGWRAFCKLNEFKAGNELKFKFVNPGLNNYVTVEKVR